MSNKEHPILFNGEMIRGILNGKKTQTRRIIKPQPNHFHDFSDGVGWRPQVDDKEINCPFGEVGDTLWVRESLRRYRRLDFLENKIVIPNRYGIEHVEYSEVVKLEQKWTAQYIATGTAVPYAPGAKEGWCGIALWQWKNKACPSIHMPRWASRITLKVKDISVKQVQNVPAESEFSWNIDYGKTEYSWDNNPWVWVINFDVL